MKIFNYIIKYDYINSLFKYNKKPYHLNHK